ncbi:MAG: FAD/NAD(P)-binding protein [Alphaproteobacteria bacterium]|nr:FAD/NAD(P)-binding protein [Alphaproteobacteria bacterium]
MSASTTAPPADHANDAAEPRPAGPPPSTSRPPAIAIIGAGFSGTLLALHLLRRCPSSVRIHLIEQTPQFGRGLAYSTGNLNHVLNVPAGRMSAFHDRPNDFLEWLQDKPASGAAPVTPQCFVSRRVFGDYVRHHLKEEFRRAKERGGQLVLTRGKILDLKMSRGGVVLELDRDRRLEADIAVLAIGNFPPEPLPLADPSFYDSDGYRPDPWAPDALTDLDPEAPLLLIGTGLTMVDTAISLLDRGHAGPIYALSRRGLLPRRHSSAAPAPAAPLIERPLPTTAAGLTRALRREVTELEANGGDWRAVIDGLRPTTQDVWQAMPVEERARFLRHLRPWWEVHRHRVPPAVADRIEDAIARNQLFVSATRIRQMQAVHGGVNVTHRPRRAGVDHHLYVQRVINCSGPGCDYDRIADPLIRRLLDRGDIRPDRLRLGLDVSSMCALRNSEGAIWQRLYAIGPVTRPVFWEVTSVPDIRRQCEALAAHLSTRLTSVLPPSPPPPAVLPIHTARLVDIEAPREHGSDLADNAYADFGVVKA